MTPFLKGITIGVGITVAVGAGIVAAYFIGRHQATQEDILKALNTQQPPATYQLQATPTYPITVATPTSVSPKPSPTQSSSKPIGYKVLTKDEIVLYLSKTSPIDDYVKRVLEGLTTPTTHRINDFVNPTFGVYGIKGNFSSDNNEDIVLIPYDNVTVGLYHAMILTGNSFQGFQETHRENLAHKYGNMSLNEVFAHNPTGESPEIIIECTKNPEKTAEHKVKYGEPGKVVLVYNFDKNRFQQIRLPTGSRLAIRNLDGGPDELTLIEPSGRPHVYKFDGTKIQRNVSSEAELAITAQSMVDAIRTSSTHMDAIGKFNDIWDKDPTLAFEAATLIGGENLEQYLDGKLRELGLSLTFQTSAQLRQLLFFNLVSDLDSRNALGVARDLAFGYLLTNVLKNSLATLPSAYTSNVPREVPFYPFLPFDGQLYGPFGTPEEKEQKRRDLEQQKREWYAYRTVETVTDPNTGTTRTVGIYATEEQAKNERLRRERQNAWQEGVKREKEAFGFSPAEMLESIFNRMRQK